KPFSPIVTTTSTMMRSPISACECRNKGKVPRRIPCSATAWMIPRSRLTPRATKLSVNATIKSVSTICAIASPHQKDDAERGQEACGDHKRRSESQAHARHGRFHNADEDGLG